MDLYYKQEIKVGVLVLVAFAATMTFQARSIAAERDQANREAEAKGQVTVVGA